MRYTRPIIHDGFVWRWNRGVTLDYLGGTLFSVYEREGGELGLSLAFDAIAGTLWDIMFVGTDKAVIWKAEEQDWSYVKEY